MAVRSKPKRGKKKQSKNSVEGRNGGTLYPFKLGQSGNPNGRPKKWYSQFLEAGYSMSEINDCIDICLSLTEDEAKRIHRIKAEGHAPDRKKATLLELGVISAIRHDIARGEFRTFEMLLSRRHGFPKISQNITTEQPLFPE